MGLDGQLVEKNKAMNIICERELEATGPEKEAMLVKVQIFQPFEDPREGGDWACTYAISGFQTTHQHTMYGIDSVQALILAIKGIDATLKQISRTTAYSIKWYGMEDLGFAV